MKKNKVLIGIIIVLSLALISTVGYIVGSKINEDNNHVEDNKISDKEALTIATDLYNSLINSFAIENITYDTNYNNYIDSETDSRCSLGIGCMPITNWQEFTSIMSENYKLNKTILENYGIEVINNKPYIIDGFEPSYEIIDYTLEINTNSNKEISFNVNLNTTEGTKTKKLTIIEENDNWKIKDFD